MKPAILIVCAMWQISFNGFAQPIELKPVSDGSSNYVFTLHNIGDRSNFLVNFKIGNILRANEIITDSSNYFHLYSRLYESGNVREEVILVDTNLALIASFSDRQYIERISDTRYIAHYGVNKGSVALVDEKNKLLTPAYKNIEYRNGFLLCDKNSFNENQNYCVHDINGQLLLADSSDSYFMASPELVVYDSTKFTTFINGKPVTHYLHLLEYDQKNTNKDLSYLITTPRIDSLVYDYTIGYIIYSAPQLIFNLATNSFVRIGEYNSFNYLVGNLVIVNDKNKKGVYTISGEEILPIEFDYINLYYDDYDIPASSLEATRGKLTYEFNFSGDSLQEKIKINLPQEQLPQQIVKINNFYGVQDENGNMIIDPEYDYITETDNGFFIVYSKKLFGLVNSKGELIIEPKYHNFSAISPGIFHCAIGSGKYDEEYETFEKYEYYYLNSYGEKIPGLLRYAYVMDGGENILIVYNLTVDENENIDYTFGYSDLQGKIIIPLQYAEASQFVDGKAIAVNIELKELQMIDTSGLVLKTLSTK